MPIFKLLQKRKSRRSARTRAKIFGTSERPRLAVFRSNKAMVAQLIDDVKGHTMVAKREGGGTTKGKIEVAFRIGEEIGKMALEKGIRSAVFDRRSYQYHGRVKAVAEGARKAGLQV